MTPKKVIEALENEIHLVEWVDGLYAENISLELLKSTRDLINSQQTEIVRLRSMNSAKLDTIHDLQTELENLERNRQADNKLIKSLNKCYEVAKSEAKKKFAKKLKEVWWDNGYESPDVNFDDFVDNLVKEMEGETK